MLDRLAKATVRAALHALLRNGRTYTPIALPWRWRCSCGARSRGGWSIESDAACAAQQHWARQQVPHPHPEVYDERRP